MNTQTGEVRDYSALSAEERRSGDWVPIRGKLKRKYRQKSPVSDVDRAAVIAAEEKRLRRRARRLKAVRRSIDI